MNQVVISNTNVTSIYAKRLFLCLPSFHRINDILKKKGKVRDGSPRCIYLTFDVIKNKRTLISTRDKRGQLFTKDNILLPPIMLLLFYSYISIKRCMTKTFFLTSFETDFLWIRLQLFLSCLLNTILRS